MSVTVFQIILANFYQRGQLVKVWETRVLNVRFK